MKKKSALDVINIILAVFVVVAVVAAGVMIATDSGPSVVVKASDEGSAEAGTDAAAIEALTPGTYGGIEFNTVEDVVDYYVKAYNLTKTKTVQYQTDSGVENWYALIGEEDLQIHDVLVEGKSNSLINGLVPSIVGSIFSPNPQGLPPCDSRNSDSDTFKTSSLTAEDVVAANVKDNGDGTITLQIQPKSASMSAKGQDPQGRFFNTLGDIGSTVESISILSWASGTTEDNCKVEYGGGSGTITIDTASGEITAADYNMKVTVTVTHASISVIKDKSASLQIDYNMHFPASDEWMAEHSNGTRV